MWMLFNYDTRKLGLFTLRYRSGYCDLPIAEPESSIHKSHHKKSRESRGFSFLLGREEGNGSAQGRQMLMGHIIY